jgi:lambda family phage portal protein
MTGTITSSVRAVAPGQAAPMAFDLALPATPGQVGPKPASASLFKNIETFPGQVFITPPKLSARQEGRMARADAVRAARAAERTNEHIRGGIDKRTDMVVGSAIRAQPQPNFDLLGNPTKEERKAFVQAAKREFTDFAFDPRCLCDGEGHYDFGGLMWMACRNLAGPDAETAGIIHYDQERADAYNSRWATYVSVVDPDRVETPPQFANDPLVTEGRRLDKWNRQVGLYIRNFHPSEPPPANDTGVNPYTYVPRETYWGRAMSWHWFIKTRAGQQRGITTLVNSLRQSGMLDSFDDAYLGAAILNQVLATYVKTASSAKTVASNLAPASSITNSEWNFGEKADYYDRQKFRVHGAQIAVLPPDDEIVMEAVNRAIGDPSAFRNNFLRQFASALGINFEQISNNFSETNYSSARAALLEVWRSVLSIRRMFTAHVASLIYGCVIEEAIAKRRIPLWASAPPFQENRNAYTGVAWTGPGMGWIDPAKEAQGLKTLLDIKMTSRTKAANERGDDIESIFDEIQSEREDAEDHDFLLDTPIPGITYVDDPNAPPGVTGNEGGDARPAPRPAPAPANQE